MNVPEKHRAVAHAWLDGAEVEHYNKVLGEWILNKNPRWYSGREYRVKAGPRKKAEKKMTFEEWWKDKIDNSLASNQSLISALRSIAAEAWQASEWNERDRRINAWSRAGLCIDEALRGKVDESSPIANRLRTIADLAKVAQRHDEEVNDDI